MKSVPSWVSYSVFRVLLFAVPLAILLMLGIKGWVAAVIAAIVSMSLSFIVLRKPREKVALDLYAARHRDAPQVHEDAEVEDAALDREEHRPTAPESGTARRRDSTQP